MNFYFLEYFDIFMIQKDFDLDSFSFVAFFSYLTTVNALNLWVEEYFLFWNGILTRT